jgi:hypothetical protein
MRIPQPRPAAVNLSASAMVRYCLDRATECRRSADRMSRPAQKRRWLKMAGHWFVLARSYDGQQRIEAGGNVDGRDRSAVVVALERKRHERGTFMQLAGPERARG